MEVQKTLHPGHGRQDSQRWLVIAKLILGGILVAASLLKLFAFSGDIPSQYFYFWHPLVFGVLATLELVLGCYLVISPISRRLMLTGLVTFIGFSVISLVSTLQGKQSCGCLGNIQAAPWQLLIVDLIGVVIFGLASVLVNGSEAASAAGKSTSTLFGVTSIPVVLGIIAAGVLGGQLISSFDRQDLYVVPASANLGQLTTGQVQSRQVLVRNDSGHPFDIIGFQSTCACALVTELPKQVAVGEILAINLNISLPDLKSHGEPFRRHLTLWTDSPSIPRLESDIFGWTRSANSNSQSKSSSLSSRK